MGRTRVERQTGLDGADSWTGALADGADYKILDKADWGGRGGREWGGWGGVVDGADWGGRDWGGWGGVADGADWGGRGGLERMGRIG